MTRLVRRTSTILTLLMATVSCSVALEKNRLLNGASPHQRPTPTPTTHPIAAAPETDQLTSDPIAAAASTPTVTPTTAPAVIPTVTPTATPGPTTKANILWLEPFAFDSLTSAQFRVKIANWKSRGISKIVVAYSQDLDYFLFTPTTAFSFLSWHRNELGQPYSVLVNSTNPAQRLPKLSDGNLFDVLMGESAVQNISVILGLSRTGDLALLPDYENSLRGFPRQFPGLDLDARFSSAELYTKLIAYDLHAQYGGWTSFGGWYLAHESYCLDVAMRYYVPVAQYLKSLSPGKPVMISPTIDSRVCFDSTPSGAVSYLDLVDRNKSWIDTYAYQDTIGAGSLLLTSSGSAYDTTHYGSLFNAISTTPSNIFASIVNHFTDAARYQRIAELQTSGRLQTLKAVHAQTGTAFWMNVEGWEMNGICSMGIPSPSPSNPNARYGCAYPGSTSRILLQLDTWSAYTSNLMLNEGFLLDF